jgi:hypothetical protein
MTFRPRTLGLQLTIAAWSLAPLLHAQLIQQSVKLTATGAVGTALQGSSVALSADGNTAVVGGLEDDGFAGAAWVWTRSGAVWTQQGPKLVGAGAVGSAYQGISVALSADGNTALVGGPVDNGDIGAAWVWIRNGGVWTQQGPKLVATDWIGFPDQGYSVALSADGNTALVGGDLDNAGVGAVWVWTRGNGVWSQQGPKLVGAGAVGNANQGYTVALSADGSTAFIGGLADDNNTGAAWVWTRGNGVWTQQGPKLVGAGAVGNLYAGYSVALSADGNTAVVGRPGDDSNAGAAWVWTRSNGVWTQQGLKLVGAGAIGNAMQGLSVALSGDGNKALVGGDLDNGATGAAWVWIRKNGVWTQQGSKLVGTGAVGNAYQAYSVALSGGGNTALLGGLQDNSFTGAVWVFAGSDPVDFFQVRYVSNLDIGDSFINLSNAGALTLPTGVNTNTTGNLCANIYTFDSNEEMLSCCSCLVTPNGLNSLSAKTDLVSNVLTTGVPASIVIKLLATTPLGLSPTGTGGTCNPASPTFTPAGPGISGSFVPGLLAWGTTLHALPTTPVTYGMTEERFAPADLSPAELTKLTTFCRFIQGNGSGFGICKSCRTGGLGGVQR